jgi:hypothetical protein
MFPWESSMIRRFLCAFAFVGVLAAALPAAAQQVDVFSVAGSNPGSSQTDYTGEVSVAQTGNTWRMQWRVQGATIEGTGIIVDNAYLAVTGLIEGRPFVLIMKRDGNRFVGQWTVHGQTQVGREVWTAK